MEEIEVRIKGQIDEGWSDWLGGLTVTRTAGGETVLTRSVRDQSALCGLLNRLSGMGLRLISVSSERELNRGCEDEGPNMNRATRVD